MMARKDYQRAAEIVRDLRTGGVWSRNEIGLVEVCFIKFFREDNPAFDEARFHDACDPTPKPKKR